MKLDRLEAHDRLLHFKQDQAQNIFQGAEDCLRNNPDSLKMQEKSPYIYVFAHPRTADDGVTKIMWWQPRLTKPTPQENSYCFRAISKTDTVEVCWLIPPRSMWGQYIKGNVTESDIVSWSIAQYKHNKKELEKPHPKDLPDHITKAIWESIICEMKEELMTKKLFKPQIESASLSSPLVMAASSTGHESALEVV